MGRKGDSFGDRLWDAIDDAFRPPSLPEIFHEPKGEDYRDYSWGDSSSDGEDTKNWWVGCLVLLLLPFSPYIIAGLCAVIALGLEVGMEILGNFVDQLFTLFSGL